ncbi:deoxyhypusine synthase [Vavraia culicis subsp. floridensis]|uniref:deoxyhypusine synthase n=1 Tax=Vavraia culicis (isolate floridensis) TaxID=948595 RepID=L2GSC6_VAVCU|nr:deoxyhypusine synthase [Vavraia culicis subsp. floridensis]ELA46566.1 deoxyhypusine synthase [Vavraia culicis subsp. floridensis]
MLIFTLFTPSHAHFYALPIHPHVTPQKTMQKQVKQKRSVKEFAAQHKHTLSLTHKVAGPAIPHLTLPNLLSSFRSLGYQSINMYRAVKTLKAAKQGIILAFTSNIISCGLRDTIRYLIPYCKAVVTTTGAIEEDIIKTANDFYVTDYHAHAGHELRANGYNRIGNLAVHNDSYVWFEAYLRDRLVHMEGTMSTAEFVDAIAPDDDRSFVACAKRMKVPVFVCALGDGSIGDVCTFGGGMRFRIDVVRDFHHFLGVAEGCTGLVVGDGAVRHRMAHARMSDVVHLTMRTAYDGSDWECELGNGVRVVGEASVLLPLLVYGAYECADFD